MPARQARTLWKGMSEMDAAETLQTVTNWARYAEYFAYDEQSDTFSLENPS